MSSFDMASRALKCRIGGTASASLESDARHIEHSASSARATSVTAVGYRTATASILSGSVRGTSASSRQLTADSLFASALPYLMGRVSADLLG